jgi:hypothetical protein
MAQPQAKINHRSITGTGRGGKGFTGDEEQAGLELLEEHDALPHVPPGEQDQHRPRRDGRPELGRVGLAGAGGAGLDVVGGVELGLGGGGGLAGLGEGAAVLGLDGPEPAAVVGVRPRRALDALRQLRRRRHCCGRRFAAARERGWRSRNTRHSRCRDARAFAQAPHTRYATWNGRAA